MKQTKVTNNKKFIIKPTDRMTKFSFLGMNIYSSFYSGNTLIRKFSFLKYKKTDISKLMENRPESRGNKITPVSSLSSLDFSKLQNNSKNNENNNSLKSLNDFQLYCEEAREKFGITDANAFFNKLEKYCTGRIDIQSFGHQHNSIEIVDCSDKQVKIKTISVSKKDQGNGLVIQSVKGDLSIKVRCIGDGFLNIRLRGVDCKISQNNENRIPIYMSYHLFNVDNEKIIDNDEKIVSHDTPLYYKKSVTNGQVVSIKLEWKTI